MICCKHIMQHARQGGSLAHQMAGNKHFCGPLVRKRMPVYVMVVLSSPGCDPSYAVLRHMPPSLTRGAYITWSDMQNMNCVLRNLFTHSRQHCHSVNASRM